jgi:hypothetical protein
MRYSPLLVIGLLVCTTSRAAAGDDTDPRRWLKYKELKGSLRVGSGKGETALGPLWTEGKSTFRLQATYTLRPVPGGFGGEIVYRGTLQGIVDYRATLKGVTTEELRSRASGACGGAILPDSEITLKVSTSDGSYVFDATAPARCQDNKLQIERAGQEDVDIDMGDMSFTVTPSFEALKAGFRLPTAGKSIRGRSDMLIIPGGGLALPFDGFGEWSIDADPTLVVKVQPLAYDNPSCVCRKEVPVEFTATASAGGGTFGEFLVETSGTRPDILVNTGGKTPRLVLKGGGSRTGKTMIRAVYRKGGETVLSEPHPLEFCDVDRPQLVASPHRFAGDGYTFGLDNPVDFELTAVTTVWRNEQEVNAPLEWTLRPFRTAIFDVEQKPGKPRAVFRARQLPTDNRDFGKKKLVARLDDGTCNCASEPAELALFFDRDATNNPDGTRPNWAYYWEQTAAGVDGAAFKAVRRIPESTTRISLPVFSCLGAILGTSQEGVLARYEPMDDVIYMLDRSLGWICPSRPDGTREEGIDCFASLLRHENQHRVELTRWWGPRLSSYSCVADIDGDLVPNEVERQTPGCSASVPWSCPTRPSHLGRTWDVELDAYDVGWRWGIGTADAEDWSYPGKQSGRR